jgi:hypothetical protein
MYHHMFGTMVPGQIEARCTAVPFEGLMKRQGSKATPDAAAFIHGKP